MWICKCHTDNLYFYRRAYISIDSTLSRASFFTAFQIVKELLNKFRVNHSLAKVLESNLFLKIGGAREDRTPDLLRARQALSQLSYGPVLLVFLSRYCATLVTHSATYWCMLLRSFRRAPCLYLKIRHKTFAVTFVTLISFTKFSQIVFLGEWSILTICEHD